MVFQQGLAKPFHPDEFVVIFCRVCHIFLLSIMYNFIIAKKISVSRKFFAGRAPSLTGEIFITIVAPSFIEGGVRRQ
jgi:hypothetical protein